MVQTKKCRHPVHSTLDGSDEEMSASGPLYSRWFRRRNISIRSTLLYMVQTKKCRHPVHSTLDGSDEEMSALSPLYSTWFRRINVVIQSTLLYMVQTKNCRHPVHSTLHGSDAEILGIQYTLLYMVQTKKMSCIHYNPLNMVHRIFVVTGKNRSWSYNFQLFKQNVIETERDFSNFKDVPVYTAKICLSQQHRLTQMASFLQQIYAHFVKGT